MKKLNLYFLLIAVLHFGIVCFLGKSFYKFDYLSFDKLIYCISVKLISFLLIVVFWQLVLFFIQGFKNNNQKIKVFFIFFISYFLLNSVVFFLSSPLSTINFLYSGQFERIPAFSIVWHPSWLMSFYSTIFYNIFPSPLGVSFCFIIIYSSAFGYIMSKIKEICPKCYWISVIPFCFPCVLIVNTAMDRCYVGSWAILFIFFYIFFNIQKKKNNLLVCILFALLTAFTAELRTEYIIILLIIPVMVFCLNVFNKKKSIIFSVLIFLFFSALSYFPHLSINNNLNYELHNLLLIYNEYLTNGFYDKDIEANKDCLNKVYRYDIEKKTFKGCDCFDLSNKNDTYNCIYLLSKFPIINQKYFINNNINKIKYDFCIPDMYISENIKNLYFKKHRVNFQFLYYMLYWNLTKGIIPQCDNKILLTVYSPIVCYSILCVILFIGLLMRRMFFVGYFIIWSFILYIVLIFGFFCQYLYYYAFIQNLWSLLFLLLTMTSEKIYNKITLKK